MISAEMWFPRSFIFFFLCTRSQFLDKPSLCRAVKILSNYSLLKRETLPSDAYSNVDRIGTIEWVPPAIAWDSVVLFTWKCISGESGNMKLLRGCHKELLPLRAHKGLLFYARYWYRSSKNDCNSSQFRRSARKFETNKILL